MQKYDASGIGRLAQVIPPLAFTIALFGQVEAGLTAKKALQ